MDFPFGLLYKFLILNVVYNIELAKKFLKQHVTQVVLMEAKYIPEGC